MAGEEVEWLCIDSVIAEATSSLNHGELIACEGFSLYDSMSAVELLDPKMDPPQMKKEKPIDLQALMLNNVIPLHQISLRDTRNICLRMLKLEMSWVDATSLAESLFTCFYLHEPILGLLKSTFSGLLASLNENGDNPNSTVKDLGEECLACIVVLVLKKVAMMRDIVLHADIYEVKIVSHIYLLSFSAT
jgi:hypothetical protein